MSGSVITTAPIPRRWNSARIWAFTYSRPLSQIRVPGGTAPSGKRTFSVLGCGCINPPRVTRISSSSVSSSSIGGSSGFGSGYSITNAETG